MVYIKLVDLIEGDEKEDEDDDAEKEVPIGGRDRLRSPWRCTLRLHRCINDMTTSLVINILSCRWSIPILS